MSYREKEDLFRMGRYVLRIQPMVTSGWSLAEWIHYIDRCGRWLTRPLSQDSA